MGSLPAALVEARCNRHMPDGHLAVTAYEIDAVLAGYLQDTLSDCRQRCQQTGRTFDATLHTEDFLDSLLHFVISDEARHCLEHMRALPCTLSDLGIAASTGPVVDFRLRAYLRQQPETTTVPLIYPTHCRNNSVTWPQERSRKPNALVNVEPVRKWLYPNGHYTLVRRFSAKEERRRIVAVVHDPAQVPGDTGGFENHLNVLHRQCQGLPQELARSLAVYLNSTLVDRCFRLFNGHTQVNVSDLYALRYPPAALLCTFGERVEKDGFPSQEVLDSWIKDAFPLEGL